MIRRIVHVLLGMVLLLSGSPVIAQDARAGRVANSAAGEAGQRRTREQPLAGIQPTARINSRIQNRVQSRIRSRIDRNYDPQADAVSSFEAAADQARTAGRPGRR